MSPELRKQLRFSGVPPMILKDDGKSGRRNWMMMTKFHNLG